MKQVVGSAVFVIILFAGCSEKQDDGIEFKAKFSVAFAERSDIEIAEKDSEFTASLFIYEILENPDSIWYDTAYFLKRTISKTEFEGIRDLVTQQFNDSLFSDRSVLDGVSIHYSSDMNGRQQDYRLSTPTVRTHKRGFYFTVELINQFKPIFKDQFAYEYIDWLESMINEDHRSVRGEDTTSLINIWYRNRIIRSQ